MVGRYLDYMRNIIPFENRLQLKIYIVNLKVTTKKNQNTFQKRYKLKKKK